MLVFSLCMVVAMLAGGCGNAFKLDMRHTTAPTATVSAIRLAEQTADGVRVEVDVELENPNDFELPLPKCDYTIAVNGAGEFSFNDVPLRTLPASGTQTLTLVAAFAHDRGDLVGANCSVSGSVTYDPPGSVRMLLTESRVPLTWVSFSGKGALTTGRNAGR